MPLLYNRGYPTLDTCIPSTSLNSCKECDTSFASATELFNHSEVANHLYRYPCHLCRVSFPDEAVLETHSRSNEHIRLSLLVLNLLRDIPRLDCLDRDVNESQIMASDRGCVSGEELVKGEAGEPVTVATVVISPDSGTSNSAEGLSSCSFSVVDDREIIEASDDVETFSVVSDAALADLGSVSNFSLLDSARDVSELSEDASVDNSTGNVTKKHDQIFTTITSTTAALTPGTKVSSAMARSKEFYCRICNIAFQNKERLLQHYIDEKKHNWCFACNKDFKKASSLRSHIKSAYVHKFGEKKFKCPLCNKHFRTPSSVAYHIESGIHNVTHHQVNAAIQSLNINPQICLRPAISNGPFVLPPAPPRVIAPLNSGSLNGARPTYRCFIKRCSNTRPFKSLIALEQHLNSPVHDANEFKCPKCGKKTAVVSGLMRHLESGKCGLAKLKDVVDQFEMITAQFSKLIVG